MTGGAVRVFGPVVTRMGDCLAYASGTTEGPAMLVFT